MRDVNKHLRHIVYLPLILGVILICGNLFTGKASAATGINQQLSFEGKIVKSDGTNITDGTYNMEFKIYQDGNNTGSGSTLKWTEDWLVGGSGGVTFSSGTFQVNLGAHNPFASQVDWNQDTLWLSLQIGNTTSCTISTTFQTNCSGDGEMSPYIRLTSVPYALNAANSNALGGLVAANFVQLAQGLQADSSTSNASIAINKTGSTANILTLQKSGTSVLVLDNNGLLALQPAAALTGTGTQNALSQTLTNNQTAGTVNGFNQALTISNASGTTSTNSINISLTDNTSLGNTNIGANVSIGGSNTNNINIGLKTSVSRGFGIVGITTGAPGTPISCGLNTFGQGIGICGTSTNSVSSSNDTGVLGTSQGGQSTFGNPTGSGITGLDEASGTAGSIFVGVKGLSLQSAAAAYTSTGVYGEGKAGAGATTYGGYFALNSSSSATLGAALYATNSGKAVNILQLQNNNVNALVVDSSGTVQLGQGNTGGANGIITFNNSSGTGTASITLAGNPSTSYTYQLPTGTVSSNQCLQSGTVSGGNVPLTFSSCSTGGGGSLSSDYNGAATTGNTIVLTQSGGGVKIQDAASPITPSGTYLFAVQKNASSTTYLGVAANGLTAMNSSGVNALALDTSASTAHLKVFGSGGTNYVDIYYDDGTSTAVFAASTGTTQIGSATGAITIDPGVGNNSAITITARAASTWSTTSGDLTLQAGSGSISLGSTTSVSSSGNLTLQAGSSSTLTLGDGTNNMTLSTSREPTLNGTARHTRRISLTPEYAGATMTGTGTGTMTSDNETASPFHNFYKWTTTSGSSQTYSVWVRVPLPADFSTWCATTNCNPTIFLYTKNSASSASSVQVATWDTNNTSVQSLTSIASANTSWNENSVNATASAQTWAAGGYMTLQIQMSSVSNSTVQIGELRMDYLSKW